MRQFTQWQRKWDALNFLREAIELRMVRVEDVKVRTYMAMWASLPNKTWWGKLPLQCPHHWAGASLQALQRAAFGC